MKLRTIGNHISDAFKNIKRNGWMTVASVSAVAITLLLVGSLISILFNVNELATDIEEDVSVRVYVDQAANEEDQQNLESQLQELENVDTVEFSSQDEELTNVVGSYGEEFKLFAGDDNPLYDVFIVNTTSPENTASVAGQIGELDHATEVNYGGATADRLFNLTDMVRNAGAIVVIALIFTAIFLISNTIRITIFSRSTEIEIMKLVGATNWYIRWPFLIEGAITGFIGALIPMAVISYVYINGFETIMNYLSGTYFSLLPPNPFLIYVNVLILVIGVGIGSLGSALSIRKFLKV